MSNNPSSSRRPPLGLRFCPTDVELVTRYLPRRINSGPCDDGVIRDMDVYSKEPWLLPHRRHPLLEEGHWYYYTELAPLSGKTTAGKRAKRKVEEDPDGRSWNSTARESDILLNGQVVGRKMVLKFGDNKKKKKNEKGESSKARNWIMTQYRLLSASFQKHVICWIRDLSKEGSSSNEASSSAWAQTTEDRAPVPYMASSNGLSVQHHSPAVPSELEQTAALPAVESVPSQHWDYLYPPIQNPDMQPLLIQHPNMPSFRIEDRNMPSIQELYMPSLIQELNMPSLINHPIRPSRIQESNMPSFWIEEPDMPSLLIQHPNMPSRIQEPDMSYLVEDPNMLWTENLSLVPHATGFTEVPSTGEQPLVPYASNTVVAASPSELDTIPREAETEQQGTNRGGIAVSEEREIWLSQLVEHMTAEMETPLETLNEESPLIEVPMFSWEYPSPFQQQAPPVAASARQEDED
ncbi:PREDICTED: NAC domain-containing protein 55-like [Tarenaya hassleriana]|uniref:NAC domain-containing protein 55-like n=1 Tax=Tarenaya hassleriana TaxID=28532 RepID=UPI00053C91EB|nr:PREDICTED: NAC domain-containing protein 55-like [Tarenaya hassleriana]